MMVWSIRPVRPSYHWKNKLRQGAKDTGVVTAWNRAREVMYWPGMLAGISQETLLTPFKYDLIPCTGIPLSSSNVPRMWQSVPPASVDCLSRCLQRRAEAKYIMTKPVRRKRHYCLGNLFTALEKCWKGVSPLFPGQNVGWIGYTDNFFRRITLFAVSSTNPQSFSQSWTKHKSKYQSKEQQIGKDL